MSVAGQTDIWTELRDRKIHAKTINLSKGESACIIHYKFLSYLEENKTTLYSLIIRGLTKADAATLSKCNPLREILRVCWS